MNTFDFGAARIAHRPVAALALAGLLLAASAGSARADALDARFFGHWTGEAAVTDIVDNMPTTAPRNVEVEIKKAGATGFELHNQVMMTFSNNRTIVNGTRKGGDANHQIFQPTNVPGQWVAQKSCNDLSKFKTCAWAHTYENTLVVDVLSVDAKGMLNLTSAKRVLTDDGLKVTFRRIIDGELARQVEGTLKKSAP